MVMIDRRQRLAWVFVLGSFITFVALLVFVPLSVSAVLQRAERPLTVLVQANDGTVGIQQSNNGTSALFAGDEAQELQAGSTILTNATDTALIQIFTPDESQVVARIQVYGNTNVALVSGSAPRFGVSAADNVLALDLSSGRLLVSVPPLGERPLDMHLTVPQGEITIQEPGQYSIMTVNEESQFSVLDGQAAVVGIEDSLVAVTDERVVLPAEGPLRGPLDTERNLIRNGDFSGNFDNWVLLPGNVERTDQSKVEIQVTSRANEPVLNFSRVGTGHADAGVRQVVDEDLTDYQSLQVLIWMQVIDQSLEVCGQQGSECPVMVRIEYTDVNGVDQVWQQGFYALGTIGQNTPDICVACAPPLNEHEEIPFNQLVFYESGNLMEQLGQLNILPRHIRSISLISSGHTFDVEVLELAVMARE
jgi:hypothetical protein